MKFMTAQYKFRSLLILLLILFIQAAEGVAQNRKCNIRLNVFLLHQSDYPQDTPIKDTRAKMVNLDTNAVLDSETIDEFPYFANLPEGKYNLLVSRKNYSDTTKQITLDCRFTDEKNTFDEIVFLTNSMQGKPYRMQQVDLQIAGDFPAVAVMPAPNVRLNSLPMVIANEIAVNERAVYLPSPVFPTGIQKIKDQLISDLTAFVIPLNVEIDEKGNAANVKADSRIADSRLQNLIPYIIESAKKSKFFAVKVNGKPAGLSGRVNYNFSK